MAHATQPRFHHTSDSVDEQRFVSDLPQRVSNVVICRRCCVLSDFSRGLFDLSMYGTVRGTYETVSFALRRLSPKS